VDEGGPGAAEKGVKVVESITEKINVVFSL